MGLVLVKTVPEMKKPLGLLCVKHGMARFAVGPPRALPARVDQVSSVLPQFVTIVVKLCRATA